MKRDLSKYHEIGAKVIENGNSKLDLKPSELLSIIEQCDKSCFDSAMYAYFVGAAIGYKAAQKEHVAE